MGLLLRLSEHPIEGVFCYHSSCKHRSTSVGRKELRDRKYRRHNSNNVDLNRDFEINREATAIWRYVFPYRYATSPHHCHNLKVGPSINSCKIYLLILLSLFIVLVVISTILGQKYRRSQTITKLHEIGIVMKQGMNSTHPYQETIVSLVLFYFVSTVRKRSFL